MSRRVSAEELGRIAHRLSERDGQILRLVHELRLVRSYHVEGLIFTEGSPLTRARRARSALARLDELGLLARLERRIGGVRSGSSGYLYSLGPAGRRLLGLRADVGWREPGLAFALHTLAAADLHLALGKAEQAGAIERFEVEHEPAVWRRFTGLGGADQWLKPDLSAVVVTAAYELLWFIEIDRGTESLTRIARKAEQYIAYWRTGAEQRRLGVFPRVLWVAPDERRAGALEAAIQRLPKPAQNLMLVTTEDAALATLTGHLVPEGTTNTTTPRGGDE